ncbi:response regulator [Paenibacillus typhae]|uniref:Circadian input-output histidine kinase CikA n=1 Tax=Paenibacillus typhae TaxID=1174501 RepID=A0A1G8U909_9BACL|nr:response regulator [Paenibacillus typhae]SDJ50296.1 Signal transduction histidine kinase [Paenibacillus typhae]
MKIKQQIWLAAVTSILLLSSMITIAMIYLEGAPLYLVLGTGVAGVLLCAYFMTQIHRNVTQGIEQIRTISEDIAGGTLDASGMTTRSDEFGQLAQSFYRLGVDLHHKTAEERILRLKAEDQAWINTEVSEMALRLQGSVHLQTAARIFISRLATAVGGSYGAMYMLQHNRLQFTAGYAFDEASVSREPFALGSGLVGQCAVDKQMIILNDLPEHYVRVHSGLGEAPPSTLIVLPVLYENDVVAVVELATLKELGDKERQLIERTGQNMGVLINTLADVARIEELLNHTQLQKEELEAQTEELQAQTQELEAQTEELIAQTAELATSNSNLQHQMELTARQKEEIQDQADELLAQTEELAASNSSLQDQMKLTAQQKEEIQAQADELLAQTEELQDQKEQLQAQAQELLAQTEELHTSNQNLQHQMELTERQKSEIETQAAELREQMEITARQKEEIQEQADELFAQTRELQDQKEQLQAQAQELEAQTEELLAQTEDLREQMELTARQKLEIEGQAAELRGQMEITARQKEEIQVQADELLAQTRELQDQKEQLQAQAQELEAQTEELQVQTEELAVSNSSLLQQMELTEQQKEEIKVQAEEIFMAAQYKSEFLANVSHELRTPLNSLLILSQILAENKEGNLDVKQLEYVHTIFSAGKDLLQLIDEILDLAKLEVGKMTPVLEPVPLQDISSHLYRRFEQQAKTKHLRFDVHCDSRLPEHLLTDGHRLQQILNNLLSNALKFTPEDGSVSLSIRTSGSEIVFAVSDTGIGIPASKLESIFEAFQQADGTTSRKYGGTGLGLTICRELAGLLGGRIEVDSVEGKGSTFSLLLPAELPDELALSQAASTFAAAASQVYEPDSAPAAKEHPSFRESFVPDISISNPKLLQYAEMDDDRNNLESGDTLLLIIEEDAEFASILLDLARSRGFKAIVAFQGDQGLALAHAYKPDAILLDLHLPVLDGWAIISRLKSRPELRHIPVHVISTAEENQQSLAMGALSFWKKPSDQTELETAFLQIETYIRRPVKSLLIVEDNQVLRSSLVEFIAHPDVRVVAVGTGREALEQLSSHHFDCMVLDLGLSDISGFDLMEQIKTNRKLQTLPVIIYTGKDLSKTDEQRLKHYAESIVIKNVRSMERLYDETALYLHRRHADLPPDKQQLIEKLHNPEAAFAGKQILLVDDDMRNIFALSSVLEGYNMEISFAQNGLEALAHLEQHPETQLVFMDIMMPEMDGYETMKRIRENPAYDHIVIIALTARALEEDRTKCLQAGASDYISKPINTTQLVTVLKVWLIQ